MWLATVAAGRLKQSSAAKLLRLGVWGYPVAAGLRAAAVPATPWVVGLAAGGLALGRGTSGAVSMLLERELVLAAPRHLIATTLSAVNTVQMVLMLAVFPLLGLLATGHGESSPFLALAVGLVAASGSLIAALSHGPAAGAKPGAGQGQDLEQRRL